MKTQSFRSWKFELDFFLATLFWGDFFFQQPWIFDVLFPQVGVIEVIGPSPIPLKKPILWGCDCDLGREGGFGTGGATRGPSSTSSLPFLRIQLLSIVKNMLISKWWTRLEFDPWSTAWQQSNRAVPSKNELDSWLFLEKGCWRNLVNVHLSTSTQVWEVPFLKQRSWDRCYVWLGAISANR